MSFSTFACDKEDQITGEMERENDSFHTTYGNRFAIDSGPCLAAAFAIGDELELIATMQRADLRGAKRSMSGTPVTPTELRFHGT